jgi:hypothetical protein
MDIRRNNPASPRGRQGRSYHDLTAMRAASVPPTPGIDSPRQGDRDDYVPLPTTEDEPVTKLTMRKGLPEGEASGQVPGLGLDKGETVADGSGSGHEREKSD